MAADDPILDQMPPTLRRWLAVNFELISVIVMSVTAIATAWSGFQSSQWSAIQATSYGDAANDQTESVRASNEARQATSIDLAVFIAWLEATTDGEDETAEFIYEGMPERLARRHRRLAGRGPFREPGCPDVPVCNGVVRRSGGADRR